MRIRPTSTLIPLVVMSLTAAGPAVAQTCGPSAVRPVVVVGGFAAGQMGALVARDWWTTPSAPFHVVWDAPAALGQDRLLHATVSYHASRVFTSAWRWACVDDGTAAWLGAFTGIALGLPKEIGDGLHETKGFSAPDMLANTLGALLPAVHQSMPIARTVRLKTWYWPSDEYRNRTGTLPALENDYAGQRYYLAVHPGRTPGGAGWWPDAMGIAVGHSVTSWISAPPVREWYVTTDIGLAELLRPSGFVAKVVDVLDVIHFPSPGVRLRGGAVAFGLF